MSPAHEPPVAPDRDVAPPSKTRRKQAMHALQDLGEALVAVVEGLVGCADGEG